MASIISDIVEQVAKELKDDATKMARAKIKDKQRQLKSARDIVRNLEREYEDLLATLNEELSG